jgi:hypothetical protein
LSRFHASSGIHADAPNAIAVHYAHIAQCTAPLRKQQQGDEADPDHGDEAVVAQCTQGETECKLQRCGRADFAQQLRPGIDAQQGSQRHHRVGQRQQTERAGQWQQQREATRLPAVAPAEFACRDPHHQQRNQRGQEQERGTQGEGMLASQHHPEPREPGRQSGQVRIGRSEVLTFLPIKSLVDEQRQPCGHDQLEQQDGGP